VLAPPRPGGQHVNRLGGPLDIGDHPPPVTDTHQLAGVRNRPSSRYRIENVRHAPLATTANGQDLEVYGRLPIPGKLLKRTIKSRAFAEG
jgi:hypothetical protein